MKKGFTLIELLVVISIIGMLSSVILTLFNRARASARNAKVGSEMTSLRTAMQLYEFNHGSYPITTWDTPVGWRYTMTDPFIPELYYDGELSSIIVPTTYSYIYVNFDVMDNTYMFGSTPLKQVFQDSCGVNSNPKAAIFFSFEGSIDPNNLQNVSSVRDPKYKTCYINNAPWSNCMCFY